MIGFLPTGVVRERGVATRKPGLEILHARFVFEQARGKAQAIIFINELEALGRARGAFPGIAGHDKREQTLNQLLSELDGLNRP